MSDTPAELVALEDRVAAGEAWLDKNCPDWVRVFAQDQAAGLEMSSCRLCVLGYVYGSYAESSLFQDLDLIDPEAEPDRYNRLRDQLHLQAAAMGFDIYPLDNAPYRDSDAAYASLGEIWKRRIGQRLADAGLTVR